MRFVPRNRAWTLRVIERARAILLDLENGALPGGVSKPGPAKSRDGQLFLALEPKRSPRGAAEARTLDSLRHLDCNSMTPLDALTWIARARDELVRAGDDDAGEVSA